ncbi:VWA domain-containing protein [Actinocorallia longicatena]|uniref:VWA domain-containing protein n=1 Tax=Actinocorallia longicatena TaxID=111803 RepID=A0ABP6PZA8_9ACTN
MITGAFGLTVDQNRYLPENGREVHAIVTVTGTASGIAASAGPDAAEVIIVDNSGSMSGDCIYAAKRAAKIAVDGLRDGVAFAIVAGHDRAKMVYPRTRQLVRSDPATRREAKEAIGKITTTGGTAMGTWLRLAAELFDGRGGLRHAILLTDGVNQHESEHQLGRILTEISGGFVCDCRGVGTDWEVAELRRIADALLGTVDIIPDPAGLAADFRAMTEHAMGKAVADVALRIWTPQNAVLRYVKQVLPAVADLTGKRVEAGAQTGDYPTGAWGRETRDYHVCVEVPAGAVGREMRAAWIKLVAGGEVQASANVLAEWTDDEALSTRINPRVAHYTGQAELAAVIQEGLEARRAGDEDTATARLGRAVRLAGESGNTPLSELLAKVVEVGEGGTVRLRRQVDKADEMSLDTRSVRTVRTRRAADDA